MVTRPIDGNALIEWFSPYLHTGEAIPADVVIEDIRSMPTLTPPYEWVSVEEGLPPCLVDVLVVAFWYERWQTMIGWCSDNGKKWRVYTSHGEREPGGVTHWMPLPAPPDCRPPEGEADYD